MIISTSFKQVIVQFPQALRVISSSSTGIGEEKMRLFILIQIMQMNAKGDSQDQIWNAGMERTEDGEA